MIQLTPDLLRQVMPSAGDRADAFAVDLTIACDSFQINTPARLAAFLAQIAHESGELRYTKEIASGAAYEGRKDLGNTEEGDGVRFKGRGLIQLTGRANYAQATDALGRNFLTEPELLEAPYWATRVSAWFWASRGLNELADAGDFLAITRRINGGTNGLAARQRYWERAKAALSVLTEKPMLPLVAAAAPFVQAAIPALAQVAPALIRLFGSGSEITERNARAAEAVAQVAQQVTGADTVEGAVKAIQADPAKAAEFREAVHLNMNEWLGALKEGQDEDSKAADDAVARAATIAAQTGGKWWWLVGGVAAYMVLFASAVTAFVLYSDKFSEAVQMLLLGQIVLGGFTAVMAFMFGPMILQRLQNPSPQQ